MLYIYIPPRDIKVDAVLLRKKRVNKYTFLYIFTNTFFIS